MRQNLSSGFPTEGDSYQSPQLQFRYDILQKANSKGADQTDCLDVEKEIIKKLKIPVL